MRNEGISWEKKNFYFLQSHWGKAFSGPTCSFCLRTRWILWKKGGLLVVYPKCSCTQPRSQGSLLPALRSEPWERGWVAVTCDRWLFKREVLIMGVWLEKFTCFEQVVAYGRWSDIEVWLEYFVCSSYLPSIWQSHGRCLTTSNHAYLFASFKIIIIKKFCE